MTSDYGKQVYVAPIPPTNTTDVVLPKKEDRFKNSAYKDLWATILWIVFVLGFAVISYFGITNLKTLNTNNTSVSANQSSANSGNLNFKLIDSDIGILVAGTAGTGFILSFLYFFAIQKFAGTMIKISLVIAIIFNFAIAGLFLYLRQYIPGVLMLLMAGIYAWCFWSWRHRIVIIN
jgi:hypothetical protein